MLHFQSDVLQCKKKKERNILTINLTQIQSAKEKKK